MKPLLLWVFAQFFMAYTLMGQGTSGSVNRSRSSVEQEVWSVRNNPATLTLQRAFQAGIVHYNNYLIPDYQVSEMGISAVWNGIHLGSTLTSSGIPAYQTVNGTFATAKKLGIRYSLGINLSFSRTVMLEYGAFMTAYGGIGFLAQVGKSGQIGAYLNNPFLNGRWKDHGTFVPTQAHLGYKQTLSPTVDIAIEHSIRLDFGSEVTESVCWKYHSTRFLFAISQPSFMYSFALSIPYKRMILQFAVDVHPLLGVTPIPAIHYSGFSK